MLNGTVISMDSFELVTWKNLTGNHLDSQTTSCMKLAWFPSTALDLFKSCLLRDSELWNQTTQASRMGHIWPASLWTMLFRCSVMSNSETPQTAAFQASLSFTISRSLLKLMFIELVMPSNHLVLYRPLLLRPSVFPSIRVFSKKSVLHIRWPKYWSFSFSFSINSSNEYSGTGLWLTYNFD